MSVEKNRQALLETLALTVEQYDRGTLEPQVFGLILEKLQSYLEAEEQERSKADSGKPQGSLHGCDYTVALRLHCCESARRFPPPLPVFRCIGAG